MLARQAGLSRGQVSNWFINARVRLWKPMVEEMYKEEFGAEMDSTNSSSENAGNGKRGKVEDPVCSEDQDRDEFQSASTHTHAGAGQLLSAYKSEPVFGMDVGALSSLGGAAFFRTRSRTRAKTPGSWCTAATWPTTPWSGSGCCGQSGVVGWRWA
jgi:hypothetical protein